MLLKNDFRYKKSEEIWNIIVQYIIDNKSFHSVTDIEYEAKISGDSVFYKGGSGARSSKGEDISKVDFVNAFNKIKSLKIINTNTIKNKIPDTIYRKRTPFIGLLYSADILEKTTN